MKKFIEEILISYFPENYNDFYNKSEIIQYLDKKSGAIDGDSKTRRNLGNIYAIYSILKAYIKEDFYQDKDKYKSFNGFDYTELWNFCKEQYGGQKLQNHSLNNRANKEFINKVAKDKNKELFIINGSKYLIHIDYIYVDDTDCSKIFIEIIEKYVELLRTKDFKLRNDLLHLLELEDLNDKKFKIENLLEEKSEARIFEIISYAILKNHYKNKYVYIGTEKENVEKHFLSLYKTGRTNANDGGIDFVMKPLGRFFQVTEVNNYDKYLLDIDKVMRFPISFVVKSNLDKVEIEKQLVEHIEIKSGGMQVIKDNYNNSIEEIITINELKSWLYELNNENIDALINDIDIYYKLELNIDDEIEEIIED